MRSVVMDRWTWWLAPWPFFVLVLVYDELRKVVLRMYLGETPVSFIEKELYYWQRYWDEQGRIAVICSSSRLHSVLVKQLCANWRPETAQMLQSAYRRIFFASCMSSQLIVATCKYRVVHHWMTRIYFMHSLPDSIGEGIVFRRRRKILPASSIFKN